MRNKEMEERANRDFNVIIKREAEAANAKRNIKRQILPALDANECSTLLFEKGESEFRY